MANSIITVLGDGVTTQYPLNFTLGILSRDYVTCRVGSEVDGLGAPVYRTLEWVTDGLVNIQGAVPGNNVPIVFKRTVPKDELQHDYSDGVPITEENLDESNLQTMMAIHEFLDGRLEGGFVQDLNMNGYKITNLGDGVASTDAVNLGQLEDFTGNAPAYAAQAAASASAALTSQNNAEIAETNAEAAQTAAEAAQAAAQAAAAGIKWRAQVVAATTAALPAGTYNNGTGGVGATFTRTGNGALPAQDGISLAVNDRLLVKDQAAPAQNGVYIVTALGSGAAPFILTRATDADTWSELVSQVVSVEQGTTQEDYSYICTSNAGGTIGTTAVTWSGLKIPILSQPSAPIATGDSVLFSDLSDSGKVKQDTVANMLALVSSLGRVVNVQTFTSSGTYTRSANVTKAIVILAGATGGGSANLTNNGTAGGSTSFGSLISCTGGAGGTLKTVDDTFNPPTAGSPTGGIAIGWRPGGAGASGYDGGGQWRFGQPGGGAPVILGYVTPGTTETVTIGAAGSGGAAGTEAGFAGFAGTITVIELT